MGERKQSEQVKMEMKVLEQAEKLAKIKNKEKLIDDLMFGEQDANKILEEHREQVAREERTKAAFSTGADTGTSLPIAAAAPMDKLFVYTEPTTELQGPMVPNIHQLEEVGYTAHVRAPNKQEAAGGYMASLGCMRAVQEAMAG